MKTKWANQNFRMLAERALLWEDTGTLIFSDVHLGKAQDFQLHGIPVPATVHEEDVSRMARLLEMYQPERVFVLGDFVHSHRSELAELQADFRKMKNAHRAKWFLTVGNHDHAARSKLRDWNFDEIKNEIVEHGIRFSHGHSASSGYAVSGHMHPVYKLGSGRDRVRLPCFWWRAEELIIPSFGEFTGGYEIIPASGENVFVIADQQVYRIEHEARRSRHGSL